MAKYKIEYHGVAYVEGRNAEDAEDNWANGLERYDEMEIDSTKRVKEFPEWLEDR